MPVEQRTGSSQLTAVIIGVVAVVVCVAAAWGLLKLASGKDGPVKVQVGDEQFEAGQVKRIAAQIDKEGPVLYSDVSGRGQSHPIFLNHFGDDPKVQWAVFSAIAPGSEEGCFLAWNAQRNLFDERRPNTEDLKKPGELCRDVTFSVNGQGLQQYPWRVDSNDSLIIDLRVDAKKVPTTTG